MIGVEDGSDGEGGSTRVSDLLFRPELLDSGLETPVFDEVLRFDRLELF